MDSQSVCFWKKSIYMDRQSECHRDCVAKYHFLEEGVLGLESWAWIPGLGFLGLESWVLSPGLGFLDLDSWVLSPGLGFLDLDSPPKLDLRKCLNLQIMTRYSRSADTRPGNPFLFTSPS